MHSGRARASQNYVFMEYYVAESPAAWQDGLEILNPMGL